MADGKALLESLIDQFDVNDYQKLHWEGTFEDYLDIVLKQPAVTRTAHQRLYDMIISHGIEESYENKEKVLRFKFFTEHAEKFGDGIFGLLLGGLLFGGGFGLWLFLAVSWGWATHAGALGLGVHFDLLAKSVGRQGLLG